MTSRFFALLPLAGISALCLCAMPANALTIWNWSFARNDGLASGSGTFTSADLAPTANTDIQVTGISGTITENGNTFGIISLNSVLNNIFRWDGSPASKLLVSSTFVFASPTEGISFTTSNGNYFLNSRDFSGGNFLPVDNFDTPSTAFSIDTSSVQPDLAPAPVPGPLPLFGVAAAFGASRGLRQRIQFHNSRQA